MKSWRIGAVSYLNSKPLVYELQKSAPECTIIYDLPSNLADQLSLGQLDVALIPSIEAFQGSGYQVVSDACIACRGPVWSVKLLSRVPTAQINSLALDEGSRTSAVLIQILLKHHYDISPDLIPLSIETDWRTVEADAVLIIGDRAIKPKSDHPFDLEIDLGQWWHDWTDLPFVFALWMARVDQDPDGQLHKLDELLSAVRDRGVQCAEQIAGENYAAYELTYNQCLDYFRDYLHFRMGDREEEGLALFQKLAQEMNLTSESRQLQIHDC